VTDIHDTLALTRVFIDTLNRRDRAGTKALLAANVADRVLLEDRIARGPEAVVEEIWSYRNSFPDVQINPTDGFASGDRATVQFTAAATYEPYTYGPRAKHVVRHECVIVTARAGKITEISTYVDWLRPIGVVAKHRSTNYQSNVVPHELLAEKAHRERQSAAIERMVL